MSRAKYYSQSDFILQLNKIIVTINKHYVVGWLYNLF